MPERGSDTLLMEKRKAARRKTAELKAAARGVASDAESTVSTRSSISSKSNSSSTSWKQRRLKAEHISSRGNDNTGRQEQIEGEGDADGQFKSLEDRLGAILETTEAQVAMILLIALDVGCTAVEMHLHDQQQVVAALQQRNSKGAAISASTEVVASLFVRIATRLVESFTGFTLFLFLIELAVLLAAFRHQFFAHAGYVLDLAVVSFSLAVELYAQTKAARLLGILRVWRVLRLVRRLVDQERAAHDTTRVLLEQEQLKLLHVRMQKDAAHESLKREYESRAGLEQLLRSYKDEIVTLKEALQIAAQAVAEATMRESPPANPGPYAYSEAAVAESSFGSYPAVTDNDYGEEYYHQEAAAVYPAQLPSDTEAQYWQESEESEYHHQEAAAAVHPTAMQEIEGKHRQNHEREDGHHQEGDAAIPTEMRAELAAKPWHESESEFEDAVDE
ncbi:COP9 signalosome complex subunit 8 [Phytophthora pseudosyringae]|uniref:COP9 signalosome complex subunit 8 n=1 Tax=Phytophthora pseudosyringae TaxID=221518 RepID=A0A8T1WHZ9_9STRA|nr:COP9 signalosome complex subunit 8 [Phytophthora pseudosyringae]